MSLKNQQRLVVWMPLLMAISVIFGMFIGKHLNTRGQGSPTQSIFQLNRGGGDKINEVLNLIYSEYVDTVNINQLTEKAIYALLEQLDPHSSYIPPDNLQMVNDDLHGNFEGIGIEFNIVNDTIVVVSAISGGPSEAVGIRAGDRIVKIDDENVASVKITNYDVIKKLRGKKGTKVKVHVARKNTKELIQYNIKRDKIPLYSLDAAYMLDQEIGYIKINRFSETTYNEFTKALDKLTDAGMKKLILDLRGNPGGYLNAATDIADEFLPRKKLIVYTEGKARKKRYYYATSVGRFETQPLAILIDEGSASASEIVAGAVQDNDRGMIVGRRSFGKGLVQEQIDFSDGSAIRLTVARYYTPTGRCIQRPYTHGVQKYFEELYLGTAFENDTLPKDTLEQFKTPGGKIVYGGGGITPDILVPYDTTSITPYLTSVVSKGIIYDFSFDYADQYRQELLKKYKDYKAFAADKNQESQMVRKFISYAAEKGVPAQESEIARSYKLLATRIKSMVARNIWKNEAFYYIANLDDEAIEKAMDALKR
jgi:carboxyl-terminal processing protease